MKQSLVQLFGVNMVERWFAERVEKLLRRGTH
jgi:hypothetical protein